MKLLVLPVEGKTYYDSLNNSLMKGWQSKVFISSIISNNVNIKSDMVMVHYHYNKIHLKLFNRVKL